MTTFRVVSDGTPAGTELLSEDGESLPCSKLTWTLDAQHAAKLTIEVSGAAIEAYGAVASIVPSDGEAAYTAGRKAMARRILTLLEPHIEDDTMRQLLMLRDERERAIVALRDLVKYVGDNDWPDELDLAHIIEKHITDNIAEA